MKHIDNARLDGLDALRGLAAFSVLLFHFLADYPNKFGWRAGEPALQFPWVAVGVRIFFVISGFVILMSLERCKSVGDFAVARFARLYPTYVAGILLTGLLIWSTGFNPRDVKFADVPFNFFFAPTLFGKNHIDSPYWTLLREVLFYVMFGGAYFFMRRRHIAVFALCWLAFSVVGSLTIAGPNFFYPKTIGEKISIICNFQFAPLFIIGLMLYKLYRCEWGVLNFSALFAACIATGIVEWPSNGWFDYGVVLKSFIYAGVVFAAAVNYRNLLSFRLLTWLGFLSYSLYLIHETFGYYIINRVQNEGHSPNVAVAAAIIVTILVAWVIHHTVELPGQRLIRQWWTRRCSASSPPPSTALRSQ